MKKNRKIMAELSRNLTQSITFSGKMYFPKIPISIKDRM
jgi:hypothetical protein